MSALAEKSQEVFMVTVPALHAGKAVVQIAAVRISANDFLEIGTEKFTRSFEQFLEDMEKGFKIIPQAS